MGEEVSGNFKNEIMKTLTIILACLLSSSVMAQKKKDGYLESKGYSGLNEWTALTLDSANSSIYSIGSSHVLFNKKTYPLIQIQAEPKTVMTVSDKDSLGNYKVWIDKKRIVWTSDSTFVLKTK